MLKSLEQVWSHLFRDDNEIIILAWKQGTSRRTEGFGVFFPPAGFNEVFILFSISKQKLSLSQQSQTWGRKNNLPNLQKKRRRYYVSVFLWNLRALP